MREELIRYPVWFETIPQFFEVCKIILRDNRDWHAKQQEQGG
jgi:hypothetical protein